MLKFLARCLLVMVGWFILPFVILYTLKKGKTELPESFYYFDNEEDGFDGDKRGWYSGYKGYNIRTKSIWKRWWLAYKWCALRNPVWNLRFAPWFSFDNTEGQQYFKGNTEKHEHNTKYSRTTSWYNVKTVINGKTYRSYFRLIPITNKKSIYLRWGWKLYPEFRRANRDTPLYKRRSICTITFRIREV